ncbi:hypothetical protein NOF04DRAFT_7006 [Fusarium oxysporum II5]|uniref:Uncharacterized protein n=3 Tax=Fusarium oxysporum species complex TaxID=171631 RepID=N1RXJ6_FUSC4|nr:uncharacterized protein FOIG_10130 [Fusarium odoratissimum NRRL 54006]EMT68947.1 hypothetical protein FOC4_g10005044 [Fusarium odoratissimum]EXL97815.1 hypothetical protein FOIG_10130 [Fusarium odoratissimum NRRL 54006]KAK2122767.1 hypothetical protein NOF04DRAFT_7006 [Fusarium oxysporum II5]TXB97262.1 hypothetical protein FocTR4_00011333 [Fusarium oxysporum f. sp. cubense]
MARPNLVTLPYDVRIKIFQDYFRVEGGYVFSSESEKLTTADGQLIDFSLMYTCRSIANDTKHLPFTLNNISFSTFFSPEWRAWAGRHQFLSHFLCILKADLIYHLQGTEMPPELESALQEKFPHLMPDFKNRLERVYSSRGFFKKDPSGLSGYAFQYWEESRDVSDIIGDWGDERVRLWGKNASMAREAIAFSLRFLGERQGLKLASLLNKAFPGWTASHDPQKLLGLSLDPWDIPSKAVLTRVGRLLRDGAMWRRVKDWNHGLRAKYRFSAVAVAIRFFRQLSVEQRQQLRGVTLIEDAYAVCSPSTHAMGLIEFCKYNPRLRIQRHIKLCRRILAAFHPCWDHLGYYCVGGPHRTEYNDGADIIPEYAVKGISIWLEEAILLPDAGMPSNSYTLCLDGEPDKTFFSDIFQNILLRHDASIQASRELFRMRPHQFNGAPPYRRWQGGHLSKALKYLIDHHSISESIDSVPLICSNFHPGQPLDIERFIQERLEWESRDWERDGSRLSFHLRQVPSNVWALD